ncbi:MAG: cupin domain-containing protein [Planctomycetales bacterium]|nr:cupin domain-containing protein [Planctomycetales bacterium]
MAEAVRTGGLNVSKVLRFREGFSWEGIAPAPYKRETHTWKDVARHVLIGEGGETPRFHVRYFEVAPDGWTTLETHRHEHVVVVMRGRGEVRLGDRTEPISFGDVVYVAPSDVHQFRCAGGEPFGFLCLVNAERDPPKPVRGGGVSGSGAAGGER